MLKKIAILSAVGLLSLSSAFAGNGSISSKDLPAYNGDFVIGLGATSLGSFETFGGNAAAVLQLGYYAPMWMIDLGGNFVTEHKSHAGMLLGHLGLRNELYPNLFVSYGAMGLGSFESSETDEWSAGAFTGLDYRFSEHFLLSAKIYPYNWDNRSARVDNNVFANATISAFYVF